VILVLIIAVGGGFYLAVRHRQRIPNVILISIDSLRYDHLGCYGYGRNTSPNIDRTAREGALFETVVSSTSWTLPAHAALFTGLPDRVHGCLDERHGLDDSRLTLAEAFKQAGYRTIGFFSGPYLHACFGFAQGFELYRDCTSYSGEFLARTKSGTLLDDRGIIGQDIMRMSHDDITNPIVLRAVRAWLDERPGGPFFLFVHLWDVHYDYIPPSPYDTMFDPDYTGPVNGRNLAGARAKPKTWTRRDVNHLEALYDGEIRFTDDTLGEILGELDRRGLKDSSIIAITADHGEAFYEHGVHGHRWTLYEEEIRIPLVVRYPPTIPANLRIRHPASIIDIAPTLLELAGAPTLPGATGRSLAPLFRTPDGPWEDRAVVCELNVPLFGIHAFALRDSRWKLIYDLRWHRTRVFDLLGDPREQSALVGDASPFTSEEIDGRYERASRELEEASRRMPVGDRRDTPPIPKVTEDQLRALGYVR